MKITRLAGLTLSALGALCYATAASTGAPAAASARLTAPGTVSTARAVPKTFIGVTPLEPTRLAVYSVRTGKLLRYLTAPEPGGGVSGPQFSPNGRDLLFDRARGTCALTIDTVPVSGGAERVLIPITGAGQQAVIPAAAAYSADGRYLIYTTVPCSDLSRTTIHLRNLRTGHTATEPGLFFAPVVFIDGDRDIVYSTGGHLVVVNLATGRSQRHLAPRGCVFGAVDGTTAEFGATLECRNGRLSVVVVSPRTFGVTRTLARFRGGCQDPDWLSIAPLDPTAALVETIPTCGPGKNDDARILAIRAGRATVLLSGSPSKVPQAPVW